jgi:hypothetical protein
MRKWEKECKLEEREGRKWEKECEILKRWRGESGRKNVKYRREGGEKVGRRM